jgi:hypothetical protein
VDWKKWKSSEPADVITPEFDYEGASLGLEPSKIGDAVYSL